MTPLEIIMCAFPAISAFYLMHIAFKIDFILGLAVSGLLTIFIFLMFFMDYQSIINFMNSKLW